MADSMDEPVTEARVYDIAERVMFRDFPVLMRAYDAQKDAEAELRAKHRREIEAVRQNGPMQQAIGRGPS